MNCLEFGTKTLKETQFYDIYAHNAIFLAIGPMNAVVVKDVGLVLNFFVSSKCMKGAWRLAVT